LQVNTKSLSKLDHRSRGIIFSNNCRLSFVMLLFLSFPLQSKGSDLNVDSILYGDSFRQVESFINIRVIFEGKDAKKIGLDDVELSNLLKLKFKNNYAGIPYSDTLDEIMDIYYKGESKKYGGLIVRVWVLGTNYPISYHIRLMSGSIDDQKDYTAELLGHGSISNVEESIRAGINDLVEKAAITFFKARDEL
jgi:hypothetical protein